MVKTNSNHSVRSAVRRRAPGAARRPPRRAGARRGRRPGRGRASRPRARCRRPRRPARPGRRPRSTPSQRRDPRRAVAQLGVRDAHRRHEVAERAAAADHQRGRERVEHDFCAVPALSRVEPEIDLGPDRDLDREARPAPASSVPVAHTIARGQRPGGAGRFDRAERVGRAAARRDGDHDVAVAGPSASPPPRRRRRRPPPRPRRPSRPGARRPRPARSPSRRGRRTSGPAPSRRRTRASRPSPRPRTRSGRRRRAAPRASASAAIAGAAAAAAAWTPSCPSITARTISPVGRW